jgi:hypothetical protein
VKLTGLRGCELNVDGLVATEGNDAVHADGEKAARFASAEAMRWLEWGARSYENFTLGLAVLCAVAVVRSAPIPRPIAYLMGLSGLLYVVQGWLAGSEGFPKHTCSQSSSPKF